MKWFWRFIFTLVLIAGWAGLGYMYADFTLGSPKRNKPVEVVIPPNTSIQEIGDILKEKKLIRESYFFRYYAEYKNITNLKAGVYEIQPQETLPEMLVKFSDGEQSLVKVTIPPGWNAKQIADRLGKLGFDEKGFLKALNDKQPKYNFEMEIRKDPKRPYRLEGYLYPNTYQFRKNAKPEDIVNAMLEQFAKRVDKLQVRDKLKAHPLRSGMSIDQWVTVASLIEREGKVKEELPRISGVIYNRLNSRTNNKLMIDASVYFMKSMEGKSATNLKNLRQIKGPYAAYNTYIHSGLPPGPISSPGEAALKAALNPEKHSYEYYVTMRNCTGKHYFADTYTKHQQYITLSDRNAKKYEDKCRAE
ncbi:endolytic transglycosylase MltG [Paenactinomyces guangxiensis]|uniref:Endolytic murein transglycosylase n=1 Tax=Paenactinomyces guangxiensis TaxID=1490290 RepID=A0A7W2A653_9BACL|nr:endolytic transglycosylase MltG [Paenactinomyces guangxiensis]MBA4493021.1 endolytic transglycosylase MltG [Paenactinomyces guangxiensis]MBH8590130.1 endolytic transglycosylase MltG [Paenactinomyces guangxiensis]